eukprot:TRINITY_DN1186_c0_g1_i1.p1 TRINITY_DN1186_c0_g1~~TRINITY_DN1186_c0_g1_i1.p1  ORF type:complete len:461 (-),score=187.26 TRINITY_DN1186_c0_g1_i1:105-1487(-)
MKNILQFIILFFLIVFILNINCRSTSEWKSRTIYQLLTDRFSNEKDSGSCNNLSNYCGGTFKGITKHLDYIAGMGFDAIWISPTVANTANGYHGYWAQDFYKVNPYFGSASDLKDFVSECHKRDIWVMVDIVANHVGPVGNNFNSIVPFNSGSDYHAQCDVKNYVCFTDEVLKCRLAGLPDLDQSNSYVSNELNKWIKELISNFSIDGIRADTVMYIDVNFWQNFLKSANTYIVGEIYSDLSCCASYQNSGAISGALSYPMFFTLRDVFQKGYSMDNIQTQFFNYQNSFKDVTVLGNFIDNHDQSRFLYQNTGKVNQYKNALVYVLYSAGIPIVYYATEQYYAGGNDPNNREILWPNFNSKSDLYLFLNSTIHYRKKYQVNNYSQIQRYSTHDFYAFTRGNTFVAITNQQYTLSYTITYHPYSEGTRLCNVLSTNDCVTVQNNSFKITMTNGLPKIYYPQ